MDVVRFTRELIDIESVTGNERRQAEFLAGRLRDLEFDVERMPVRDDGAVAAALFAYDEQQADSTFLFAQPDGSGNLCCDDSFRVACAAAVDAFFVFR